MKYFTDQLSVLTVFYLYLPMYIITRDTPIYYWMGGTAVSSTTFVTLDCTSGVLALRACWSSLPEVPQYYG